MLREFESAGPWRQDLEEALRRPEARYPVQYHLKDPWGILLPHLATVKSLCNRLALRASAGIATHRSQEALDDVLLILSLGQTLDTEPFLISYLVQLACWELLIQPAWEGLELRAWTPEQLVVLEQRLAEIHTLSGLERVLQTERTAAFLTADLLASGDYRYGMLMEANRGSSDPGAPSELALRFVERVIPGGWLHREKVEYSRLLDAWIQGGWDPDRRRIHPGILEANRRRLEDGLGIEVATAGEWEWGSSLPPRAASQLLRHRSLAPMFLRELPKVPPKAAAAQVLVDQARLACAIERYRIAESQLPRDLDALVPRFLRPFPGSDHRSYIPVPYPGRRRVPDHLPRMERTRRRGRSGAIAI